MFRLGGILFVIIGLIFIREKFGSYTDLLDVVISPTPIDSNPSVAGVTSKENNAKEITIITRESVYTVLAEEARTLSEKQQGLMYRDELCPTCGMLFYYDSDTRGGFWMKNCKIPLDIIFIAKDKTIVDIKEKFEPCAQDPCPSYRPKADYRYVLEVNGGWVEKNGVTVGDIVSF